VVWSKTEIRDSHTAKRCEKVISRVNYYLHTSLVEKNEMGRSCGAYGGGKRGAQGVGGET
jgi:hypothetical protein